MITGHGLNLRYESVSWWKVWDKCLFDADITYCKLGGWAFALHFTMWQLFCQVLLEY